MQRRQRRTHSSNVCRITGLNRQIAWILYLAGLRSRAGSDFHLRLQTIIPWSYEGGIARLTCNGISLNAKGEWLLPYWRELGGGDGCQNVPSLHGTAGVLITADQVTQVYPVLIHLGV